MFLPLPFGMDTSKEHGFFKVEIERFVERLSETKGVSLDEFDERVLKTRWSLVGQFMKRGQEVRNQLVSELPSELPEEVKGFMAFGAMLTAMGCGIEIGWVSRELLDNDRAQYKVQACLRDPSGLFPPAPAPVLALGIPFLPGDQRPLDPQREVAGFMSAYGLAACGLLESVFLTDEAFGTWGGSQPEGEGEE